MKMITIITSFFLMGFIIGSCAKENPQPEVVEHGVAPNCQLTLSEMIKRGEYLVNSIGCDDCHSSKLMGPNGPEIDPKLRLSGHPSNQPLAVIKDRSILNDYALFNMSLTAAVGSWGTSFAANLTPDDTGIGYWSEAQFLKAIKEGKLKGLDGSRPLLPPMPWFVYKNLTDDDLKAIFAYLQSLPPVNNVVPAPSSPSS